MISTPQIVDTEELITAVIPLVIPCHDMPTHMDPAIEELMQTLLGQGIRITGPMFSFHHRRPSETFDFEIGFPVASAVESRGRVVGSRLPALKVARTVYQGPYEGLSRAWPALQKWMQANGHVGQERFWESYLNNPDEVKSAEEYRTELNWVLD